jgi:hypothetical protein
MVCEFHPMFAKIIKTLVAHTLDHGTTIVPAWNAPWFL